MDRGTWRVNGFRGLGYEDYEQLFIFYEDSWRLMKIYEICSCYMNIVMCSYYAHKPKQWVTFILKYVIARSGPKN